MPIEFRMFGGVEAFHDGEPLFVGPTLPRTVLAVLLLAAGSPVSLDDLIIRVWGPEAPNKARVSLRSYLSRLRRTFVGEVELVRTSHGYALRAGADTIDVHRFRTMSELARKARRPEEAVHHLDQALRLWRAEPFAGLPSPWLDEIRTSLNADREWALLDRADLMLGLGRHHQVVVDLTTRVEQHPLDERLAAQFLLALHRSGRQADALAHFGRVKAVLAEELGIDPGPALRELHAAILGEDPRLSAPEPADLGRGTAGLRPGKPTHTTTPMPIPRQLPVAPFPFIGRDDDLGQLTTALTPAGKPCSPVSVITGPGGIGKTSLALQWAHRHVDLFPDGQLFADLHGFDSTADPVSPLTAMRNFLLALRVHPAAIPTDPAAMTGLYRSILSDKRVLLVLDNVRDVEHVAPLLPGGPNCATIITSRNRLTGLVATRHAHLCDLDVLNDSEAHALLVARLGSHRAAVEPDAVRRLVAACGGLPLALSITVGLAQEHPDFSLSALATDLRDAEHGRSGAAAKSFGASPTRTPPSAMAR